MTWCGVDPVLSWFMKRLDQASGGTCLEDEVVSSTLKEIVALCSFSRNHHSTLQYWKVIVLSVTSPLWGKVIEEVVAQIPEKTEYLDPF